MSPLIPAIPRSDALRIGAAAAALLGAAALVGATSGTVIAITVGTTSRLANLDTALSGWDRHGPALLLIAAFALVMLAGALRGARPAMVAVLVCGVAVLAIAVVADLPHLDDTGQIGELYTDARAAPGVGFWLEALGGALLVSAGGGLLLAARGAAARTRPAPVAAAGASRSPTAQ